MRLRRALRRAERRCWRAGSLGRATRCSGDPVRWVPNASSVVPPVRPVSGPWRSRIPRRRRDAEGEATGGREATAPRIAHPPMRTSPGACALVSSSRDSLMPRRPSPAERPPAKQAPPAPSARRASRAARQEEDLEDASPTLTDDDAPDGRSGQVRRPGRDTSHAGTPVAAVQETAAGTSAPLPGWADARNILVTDWPVDALLDVARQLKRAAAWLREEEALAARAAAAAARADAAGADAARTADATTRVRDGTTLGVSAAHEARSRSAPEEGSQASATASGATPPPPPSAPPSPARASSRRASAARTETAHAASAREATGAGTASAEAVAPAGPPTMHAPRAAAAPLGARAAQDAAHDAAHDAVREQRGPGAGRSGRRPAPDAQGRRAHASAGREPARPAPRARPVPRPRDRRDGGPPDGSAPDGGPPDGRPSNGAPPDGSPPDGGLRPSAATAPRTAGPDRSSTGGPTT